MASTLITFLHVLLLLLLSATSTVAFTMKLIPRDSLHPNNLTKTQRLERLIQHSKTYVRRYDNSHLLRPIMKERKMFYLVQALIGTGIGDGHVPSTLHFDLASDLTWIQCHPCDPCFEQPGKIFDPRNSTSFRVLHKDNPLCIFSAGSNNPRGYCSYTITYFDGTTSSGYLSQERFSFDSDNGNERFIYPLAFGCTMSSNFPHAEAGIWDGIIGMGRGKVSIVSQLGPIINHRFSYCLVRPESGLASYLTFGSVPRQNYRATPILIFPGSGNYFLNLLDISVGTKRLNLPAGTFRHNGGSNGGFAVDTGAALTHLIRPAYAMVTDAMMHILEGLHLNMVGSWNDLDLCYAIPADHEAILPGMVFHFQGADFEIPWDNVFFGE